MPDHFYVYPSYLLKTASRTQGRRVPADVAMSEEVTVEEMLEACKALGVRAEGEAKKVYPRSVGVVEGRIKVIKKAGLTKSSFLRKLAAEVRRRQPAK